MTFRVARSVAASISFPASAAWVRKSFEELVNLAGRRRGTDLESGELRACHRRLRRLRIAFVEVVDVDQAVGFRNRPVTDHLVGQDAADQNDC